MTVITICETASFDQSPNAAVSFDNQGNFPVTVNDPFSEQDEKLLEWYFEQHLCMPFLHQVRAKEAAASVKAYGEQLFEQVFKQDFDLFSRYGQAKAEGVSALKFEIVGSPGFHKLHWEALKDPKQPKAFVIDAPMVRCGVDPVAATLNVQPSPVINLLVVTARPGGKSDVGYRTISRPLVGSLRKAELPVRVDILRPGTYRALTEHLRKMRDNHGVGYYHIIHFDMHGALMEFDQVKTAEIDTDTHLFQRYGRSDMEPFDGKKAFLFFEGEQEGRSDPAESGELAELLIDHHIPVAVLNACQSGKQVGAVEETSLGSRLLQAGVRTVLAMGYTVTVSAAELLMKNFYRSLFENNDLSKAFVHSRAALYGDKERRAYFNQCIKLEDWMLPVAYQTGGANAKTSLEFREFTLEESAAFYNRQAVGFTAIEPEYGFVGRDLDILQIEKRLLQKNEGKRRNLLFIRGMGGAGKTSLLRHLGEWWQTTRFVKEVFYFGYDEKAWTLHQIMDEIAAGLFQPAGQAALPSGMAVSPEMIGFRSLAPQAQAKNLAQKLRNKRHLLILDNLESVTGENLAIQNTLPIEEREILRNFLADLLDGETLVLLGSRGGEAWLVDGANAPLRKTDIYDLPGLDSEAASTLADRILKRHVQDNSTLEQYRKSDEFKSLLKLLDGYPLPLEVVLANLSRQTPADVLKALQAGVVALDPKKDSGEKTESILKCIDYSHSNLSEDAQKLLLCIAPFTGVIDISHLPQYIEKLKAQEKLADLPFENFEEVLKEAGNWGLLTSHEIPIFLHLQPIFPYFLRARLNDASSDFRQAVERAFRQFYDGVGGALGQMLTSKEAQEKQTGQVLTRLEYENLMTGLKLALGERVSISEIYTAIDEYIDITQDHQRGIEFGQMVLSDLEKYPADLISGDLGFDLLRTIGDIARRQRFTNLYEASEKSYQKALKHIDSLDKMDEKSKSMHKATTYHELGVISQAQRQYDQAENYYQQALKIQIEFNDRYSQARIYHQLGRVSQEQRQYDQAENYYQQALKIKIEFNDRYSQASTYHQLGIVSEEQRQYDQAENYYQQALKIKIEFNDRYSQAGTYHQLGIVSEEQRQYDQAENYYQQALKIQIEFNDRYSQASTYHQLGRVSEAQQLFDQAREYYLKDLGITFEFGGEHDLNITINSLARLWQASKDKILPAAIAEILKITPQEAEERLKKASE
ncbi:tetratricopeptide repeat protein [Desulfobacterales bacterium HSG16]|nr:tetratricopeptide repeat protein [Desulfobacterales bacterium HSG16]